MLPLCTALHSTPRLYSVLTNSELKYFKPYFYKAESVAPKPFLLRLPCTILQYGIFTYWTFWGFFSLVPAVQSEGGAAGDELCGPSWLLQVLQVVIVVIEEHAVLPLLCSPFLIVYLG